MSLAQELIEQFIHEVGISGRLIRAQDVVAHFTSAAPKSARSTDLFYDSGSKSLYLKIADHATGMHFSSEAPSRIKKMVVK